MFMIFKQFTSYPCQQRKRVGLSKILKFNLLLSRIDNKTFFCQTLIHKVGFPPQIILLGFEVFYQYHFIKQLPLLLNFSS